MRINSTFKAFISSVFLASSFTPAFAGGPVSGQLTGISANGRLVIFRSNDPETATSVKIRGLQKKEKLPGIDVRPLNGQLHGLGVDATEVAGFDVSGSTGSAYAGLVVRDGNKKRLRPTLFTVNLGTGAATPLGRIGGPFPLTSLTVLPPLL